MKLSKWNYKKHEYEEFDSHAVNPSMYEADLDKVKDCANCGKSFKFGDMYTSRVIHNEMGLGWGVCSSCYEIESNTEELANEELVNSWELKDENKNDRS